MTDERRIFRGSPHYYERVRGICLGQNELDYLIFHTPPVCNYRCQFCFSGMGNRRECTDALTDQEISNLMAQAQDLGAFYIEISGEGEPLLYRRTLENIINFATPRGIHTLISTNGSLLTEDFLNFLTQNDASLTISLDYLDRDRYESFVHRQNTYDNVIRNIELARNIFRPTATNENGFRVPRLNIHTIVTADNLDQIPHIREYAGDDIFFSIAPLMNRGNTRDNPQLLTNNQRAEEMINAYSDGSIMHSDSSIAEVGRPVCGNFYYGLGVRYNGEVLANCHAYETADMIDNVRDRPLRDTLHRVRELRRTYLERFDDGGFCPLRNPNFDAFVEWLRMQGD